MKGRPEENAPKSAALVRRGTAPSRHVYDIIVIGGQLAGAFTTALLARRGIQVLHVPHDGLSAPYVHKDYLLPMVPFLMPPAKSLAVLEELATEVGVNTTLNRALVQPSLQLIRPGNWFELKRDEKERATELKRALRTGADRLEAELATATQQANQGDTLIAAKLDMPPEGFWARWKFKRNINKFGPFAPLNLAADGLAAPLRALMPLATSLEMPSPLSETRGLGRLLLGPAVLPDGVAGLHALFIERARELGADVLGPDESVEFISFDGSATSGVRLTRADTIYRAALLVGASDLETLMRLVPENRRKNATRAASQVPANKALFTLNVVVPENGLPPGLASLAIIHPDGHAPIICQVSKTKGPAIDSEKTDLRTLTLSTVAPLSVKQGNEPAVRAFIDALWRALEFVFPFTRKHARAESTPWLDAATVIDGRAEPHPLFVCKEPSYFGVTGLETGGVWKRLLLANRQVYPGLGLEGDVLAAQRAVARIEKSLKKNDPLRARKSA